MDEQKMHYLKCWPGLFDAVTEGRKNFDVRKADRKFQIGDKIRLLKYDAPKRAFIGPTPGRVECFDVEITYLLEGGQFGIAKGYVVIGHRAAFPEMTMTEGDALFLNKRSAGEQGGMSGTED